MNVVMQTSLSILQETYCSKGTKIVVSTSKFQTPQSKLSELEFHSSVIDRTHFKFLILPYDGNVIHLRFAHLSKQWKESRTSLLLLKKIR